MNKFICKQNTTSLSLLAGRTVIVLLIFIYPSKYCYFHPLFDRPKINIVFSNTLKVRSCIANQIYNSKKYSLEKKKQNTGFVWNAASASDFRHYFYLLMIRTKTKFTYTTNSSILLAPQSVNHTSLKNLEILLKNAVFTYLNTSQKYTPIRPCILF